MPLKIKTQHLWNAKGIDSIIEPVLYLILQIVLAKTTYNNNIKNLRILLPKKIIYNNIISWYKGIFKVKEKINNFML